MMEWTRLLSSRRLRRNTKEPPVGRTEFQRDRDRIVFSEAFRRLADKTQVHPLSDNDHIRTRLTHSIEVASVGRTLGMRVGETIIERHDLKDFTPHDFANIVEAASLAHDLGNPPFGHSGESAISAWFRSGLGQHLIADLTEQKSQDFQRFEGNAQGFRLLTNMQNHIDNGGLQLTCAVLGAFTKYPCSAMFLQQQTDIRHKKHGFFFAEETYFREIAEELGLIALSSEQNGWCRHPLAFLTEAADDICYLIADLEDGHSLGRIGTQETTGLLNEIARVSRKHLSNLDAKRQVAYLRAMAIDTLIGSAHQVFLDQESNLLGGYIRTDGTTLLEHTAHWATLRNIEIQTRKLIFNSDLVLPVEIAGYETIAGLLDAFGQAILNYYKRKGERKKMDDRYRKLLYYCGIDEGSLDDKYEVLLSFTDYISGMTDSYAIRQYQIFKGIRYR